MLLTQFILQNVHFGLNLFAFLVFFAVFWLYYDAWTQTKHKKDLLKIIGFLLLSISYLLHATYIEQSVLSSTVFNGVVFESITNIVKIIALLLLTLGLILDPLQDKPKIQEQVLPGFAFGSVPQLIMSVIAPILSIAVFMLILKRATLGLEKHLKPLAIGFFFISLDELLSVSKIFENTNNINIYNLVKPFGPLWFIAHLLLLIGTLIIAKWVFGYLLERVQSQLFMIINTLVLVIFLISTVSFTGLLLNNLQQDALSHLNIDVNVAQYAVNSKQAETLSDAELVSQNSALQNAILTKDNTTLKNLTTSILLAKKESYLIITAPNSTVIMRGEDNEKIGDSFSSDSLYKRAARGEKASSVVTIDGAIAPVISIRSAVPIINNQKIIGVVIVGTNIDNAFVDGLKASTKLSISVYADNTLSATTFIAADGKSRFIGVKEVDSNINKKVLIEGKNYSASTNVLNVPYFAAYSPLKDVDGNPVGMLFVGKEQSSVIQAASVSIEYTFIVAVILILISILPSFLISRFITKQYK